MGVCIGIYRHARTCDLCTLVRICCRGGPVQVVKRTITVWNRTEGNKEWPEFVFCDNGRESCSFELFMGRTGKLFDVCVLEPSLKGIQGCAQISTLPADSHLATSLKRDTQGDLSSAACLQTCRDWLSGCLNRHNTCKLRVADQNLPTRVIDLLISPHGAVRSTDGRKAKWAALSYQWGTTENVELTKQSLYAFSQSLPRLPATIADAIRITRALGIQYLWIDALCIMQDSDADWAAEAVKMSEYYGGAIITIIAANSPHSQFGILHSRPRILDCTVPFRSPHAAAGGHSPQVRLRSFGTAHASAASFSKSGWRRRGWTLQEELFSVRKLIYTEHQMLWECLESQETEGGVPHWEAELFQPDEDTSISSHDITLDSAREFLDLQNRHRSDSPNYNLWYHIISQYSRRSLTRASDKLVAISALAKRCIQVTGWTYWAGLWIDDIVRGLLWKPQNVRNARCTGIAPSWSWATFDNCGIEFPQMDRQIATFHSYEPVGDPFRQNAQFAQLTISAPFQDLGRLDQLRTHNLGRNSPALMEAALSSILPHNGASHSQYSHLDLPDNESEFAIQHESSKDQVVAAIILAQRSGNPQWETPAVKELLLLESVNGANGTASAFRRIGRLSVLEPLVPEEHSSTGGLWDQIETEVRQGDWPAREIVLV